MKPDNGYKKLFEDSQKFTNAYFHGMHTILSSQQIIRNNLQEMTLIGNKLMAWYIDFTCRSPQTLLQEEVLFVKNLYQLINHLYEKIADQSIPPLIAPALTDKRFKSPHWHDNPWFYAYEQWYLLICEHVIEMIEKNHWSKGKEKDQILFFAKQILNSISPSNFILTNPEVLQKTLDQRGTNLFHGVEQFFRDLQQGQGYLNPLMVDTRAFEVGISLAITKGKVVFKNHLIELIQYSPTTEKVHEIPLLIVPPWINKYYVLDLRQNNSFVKWIVDKGYTVFIISWASPDVTYQDTTFADYMSQGLLPAIDAILKITNVKQINALGFCIGGTLLALTLAYLKAKGQNLIHSTTFLATLLDFERPGDLGLMIDNAQFALLKNRINQTGYLDGRLLMSVFNALRSNELFWPHFINNYLLDKEPCAFDLLYWNQDSTHLPAKMANEYLENLYLNNQFIKEKMQWLNTPLTLKNVNIPCYFLATEQDHIAPWLACFNGAKQVAGQVTFVLGGSGHIAGIVNPPSGNKYGYYVLDKEPKDFKSAASWLYEATKADGSWWEHWQKWLSQLSGKMVSSRKLDASLSDAPGDNVKKKLKKS
jgi:polyhydroxyalkanoate synthase